MNQIEREYREALDALRFSGKGKERIMNNLMAQVEPATVKGKRLRALRTGLIAAALAVGCVLSIAAGLPAQVYNFVAGGSVRVTEGTSETSMVLDNAEISSPLTVENGRLWLEADGEKTDITDKVDENTPYVLERTDPATGNRGYLVVGGTVDDHGWAEFFLAEGGACSMMGENAFDHIVPIDGGVPFGQLTEEQIERANADGSMVMETVNRPWLEAALGQLELDAVIVD